MKLIVEHIGDIVHAIIELCTAAGGGIVWWRLHKSHRRNEKRINALEKKL